MRFFAFATTPILSTPIPSLFGSPISVVRPKTKKAPFCARIRRSRGGLSTKIHALEERRRITAAARRSEADFFVNAAWKLLQFRKWVNALGLCATIDFSEIDKFDTNDTRDLRNMREHVVD